MHIVKIEKENIESFIFDYHEGNLSDSEKTEVLNYIHNHPEYEAEFTQWAQSYLPYESSIKNYGITNTLLQKPSTYWYNKSWIKITPSILLIAFISFYYVTPEDPTSTSLKPNTKTNTQHSFIKTELNPTIKTHSTNINKVKQSSPSVATHSNAYSNNQFTKNSTEDSSLASSDIEKSTPSAINTSSPIQKNKIHASDSVATNTNVAQPIKKEDSNKKRKSYKIKPATDFIPTNPNF